MNPHRDFSLSLFPPFVKSIRRDDAAAAPDKMFEGGFLRQRFRTSVDHPIPDGRVFGPIRNQTPMHRPALIAVTVTNDDRNLLFASRISLSWGSVITRSVQR